MYDLVDEILERPGERWCIYGHRVSRGTIEGDRATLMYAGNWTRPACLVLWHGALAMVLNDYTKDEDIFHWNLVACYGQSPARLTKSVVQPPWWRDESL